MVFSNYAATDGGFAESDITAATVIPAEAGIQL
jgi:hypothetical protein